MDEVRFQIDEEPELPPSQPQHPQQPRGEQPQQPQQPRGEPPQQQRPTGRTAQLIAERTREDVAREFAEESRMLLQSRRRWKKTGDVCEALSKGLAGIGTVMAYAASAIGSQPATDILAFCSGFVGTVGLTLFAYSSYSNQESRQRTQELNALLQSLGVTPMPDLASYDTGNGPDA